MVPVQVSVECVWMRMFDQCEMSKSDCVYVWQYERERDDSI